MDSLKLIPSIFFDAIARVVPGATAMVAYLLISGSTWTKVLSIILGPSFGEGESQLVFDGPVFLFGVRCGATSRAFREARPKNR